MKAAKLRGNNNNINKPLWLIITLLKVSLNLLTCDSSIVTKIYWRQFEFHGAHLVLQVVWLKLYSEWPSVDSPSQVFECRMLDNSLNVDDISRFCSCTFPQYFLLSVSCNWPDHVEPKICPLLHVQTSFPDLLGIWALYKTLYGEKNFVDLQR